MKTIGLIGGMSWESSAEYYRLLNEGVRTRLGGLHSARCVMASVDFADIERLQHLGRWQEAAELLGEVAAGLERAGADFLVLCTNTMHKLADDLQAHVRIPLLHIADATARQVRGAGLQRVGLIATRFTMEEDFYKGRLREDHGIDVLVPEAVDREIVHRIIYDELCLGITTDASRAEYRRIMHALLERGAEGIILGCTEIPLLVGEADCPAPLFDTTRIHAQAAVDFALACENATV